MSKYHPTIIYTITTRNYYGQVQTVEKIGRMVEAHIQHVTAREINTEVTSVEPVTEPRHRWAK